MNNGAIIRVLDERERERERSGEWIRKLLSSHYGPNKHI
jgi:hypothetical protein